MAKKISQLEQNEQQDKAKKEIISLTMKDVNKEKGATWPIQIKKEKKKDDQPHALADSDPYSQGNTASYVHMSPSG